MMASRRVSSEGFPSDSLHWRGRLAAVRLGLAKVRDDVAHRDWIAGSRNTSGTQWFFGGAEVEAIENASIVWLADMVSRKFRGFGSNLNQ